jgi:trigger factor
VLELADRRDLGSRVARREGSSPSFPIKKLRGNPLKYEKKELNNNQVEITAEVETEEFEEQKKIAARRISKTAKIPGFRPGKAPYDVVERLYGEEVIEEKAVEDLINTIYPEVIEKSGIDPYGPGKLDEIISTNPPKYRFIIPLTPKIEIGDYKKIKKTYKLPKVTSAEIDHVIEDLRTNYATAKDVEREAADGDLVTVKISAKLKNPDEGQKPEILTDTPHQVIIGDHAEDEQFPFKGFMQNLVGLKKGDKKEFSHKFKKDSPYQNLQGKETDFSIEITDVKELVKPDVTDEFAEMLGTDTVENIKNSIRDQLETSKRNEYENTYFDELLDTIIKKSTIKYPPEMLEKEIEDVLKNFEQNIANQNLDLDTYLKINNLEKEKFIADEIEPAAKKRLEQALILEQVSKEEKIELDQSLLQAEYSRSFIQMRSDPGYKKLQKQLTTKGISEALVMQTANRLIHKSTLNRLKEIVNGELEKLQDENVKPADSPNHEDKSNPVEENSQDIQNEEKD